LHALGNRVIVMKAGVAVEAGEREDIFERPHEPYTKALLAAAFEIEVREGTSVAG
jgi:microcin C transport system ATP-binding protein